ncbi:MAG TPA: glutaminyl-peptide cyclotransferase [Thermoanaerobaculia bacterium]|nr:glutaminyl-peptide cyclotransferase [Thermoanaerobaculia bacterium]
MGATSGPAAVSARRRRPAPLIAATLVAALAGAAATCAREGGGAPARSAAEPPGAGPSPAAPAVPASEPSPPASPERLTVRVLSEYPHDPEAFTQGLLLHEGLAYESTGRYGRSELRRVDPETGEVLLRRELPDRLFGEGLALVPAAAPGGASAGDRLIQLTWQDGIALVWDRARLEPLGELRYPGEGWGLAWDGERLVMSDGGSWLVFREPEGFAEISRVQVTLAGRPLARINELEWAEGALWANVWGTAQVVRIDPATGAVTGVADCAELEARLAPEEVRGIDVLNGIAWWPERRSFLVTGKLWPRAFEVVFE